MGYIAIRFAATLGKALQKNTLVDARPIIILAWPGNAFLVYIRVRNHWRSAHY